jgi:D-alanyl-D-alanine carboxypeptidase
MNVITAKPLCVLVLLIALPFSSFGDGKLSPDEDSYNARVDDLVRTEMNEQHVPGVALAVVKNGKMIKTQAYGLANVELKIPTRTDTVFRIGSVSKSFVATAIMMLVEEGKLSLDDPVSKYLNGTPDKWKQIVIRNLLTHTSGIPDFFNEDLHVDPHIDVSDQELLKAIVKPGLHFKPGDEWRYSNSNYHLLAMIIHKISGKPYGDFLRTQIFEPLGMSRTTVSPGTATVPGLAAGYEWKNDHLRPGDNLAKSMKATGPGGILSSVLDMAKWDAALYTQKLLKESSLLQMWTPVRLNNGDTPSYGFGWIVGDSAGHHSVWHNGGISGFSSAFYRLLDDQLTVIVLANRLDFSADTMAKEIAGIYVPIRN